MTSSSTLIIIIAAVLLVASIVALVILAIRNGALKGEKAALEGQLKAQDETYKALDAQRAEQLRLLAEERAKAFEVQRKQMEESFKVLSEQNSAGLRRQNAESITELLKPIQEKFNGFEKQVKESGEKSIERDARLSESIKNMLDQSKAVGDEAKNLANALTGHSKVQGDFGEMLLTDILRNAGLEEGIHFFTQGVLQNTLGHEIKSDAGSSMIPDVVLNYPDGSQVVVDSKVSLTAFVNYMNATSLEDRTKYAKEHIASISSHIDELKTKDYASYIPDSRRKIDYNIMFIPMENAFRLMLDEAPVLWQQAKDAKVLIVSQQTLMIVLNMIQMGWKQHDQQKNIADVYKTAEELMSQLKNWMDSFLKVGENLKNAQSAFDDSKRFLMESNQSVVKKIDKLEHLKISPKRSNAKLKPGARMVNGTGSIIPDALAEGLDSDENETEQ